MDLFVKDKYYNIDSKRDLDVCLKENGFNYDELESMMLLTITIRITQPVLKVLSVMICMKCNTPSILN